DRKAKARSHKKGEEYRVQFESNRVTGQDNEEGAKLDLRERIICSRRHHLALHAVHSTAKLVSRRRWTKGDEKKAIDTHVLQVEQWDHSGIEQKRSVGHTVTKQLTREYPWCCETRHF